MKVKRIHRQNEEYQATSPTPTQIRELLKESGLNQTQFAKLGCVEYRTLWRWLIGDEEKRQSMHPALWELIQIKVHLLNKLQPISKNRLTSISVRDIIRFMDGDEPFR
jgi:DNA-binding transcriptional regulator YiaG